MPAALAREEILDQFDPLNERADTGAFSSHSTMVAPQPARRPSHRHEENGHAAPYTAREYWEEMREEAHPDVLPRHRVRTRRVHREFRVSFTTGACCALIFGQLLWMIYVKGISSAASVEVNSLDVQLVQRSDDLARLKKKNSLVTSKLHLDSLSKQLGLRLATQSDIDPVSTETRPADLGKSEAAD